MGEWYEVEVKDRCEEEWKGFVGGSEARFKAKEERLFRSFLPIIGILRWSDAQSICASSGRASPAAGTQ